MECWADSHIGMVVISVLLLLGYSLAYPIAICSYLYVKRARIQNDASFNASFGFFYEGMEEHSTGGAALYFPLAFLVAVAVSVLRRFLIGKVVMLFAAFLCIP